MSEVSIIQWAVSFAKIIGEGSSIFEDFSVDQLGLQLPDVIVTNPAVQTSVTNVKISSEDLQTATTSLETAVLTGNEADLILAFLAYGTALGRFFSDLKGLSDSLNNAITAGTIANATERTIAKELAEALLKKLTDYFIISGIENTLPTLMLVLKVFGLAEWKSIQEDSANSLSRTFVKKELHLERLKDFFKDPQKHFEDAIGWGSNGFDPSDFFELYRQFLDEEDYILIGDDSGDPFLQKGILKISRDSSQNPPGLKIELIVDLNNEQDLRTDLGGDWGIGLATDIKISGGAGLTVAPPFNISLEPVSGEISGEFRAFLDRNPDARPFDIIGGNGLITLAANNVSAGVGLFADWNPVTSTATANPLLFTEIEGGVIKIGTQGSDSFIADILSSVSLEGNFDLGLEWSALEGLKIKASGGIEIMLPMHVDLGVLEFINLFIGLTIDDDSSFKLETSTGIQSNLGVLSATVERMGAETKFTFSDDAEYGLFDVSVGFKPPSGVGLSIDAGVVKGGGYLFFDFDKGEYAGALELTFSEIVSLKAIGLITTKMPDGSDGFSMIIIITAEFGTGIQLGFGFTLLGVGGLLGLNRTMRLDALAEGVRTGATESIMFPTNVVENAPKIISDLRNFFPVEEGKFLIGPMAKLGWGTPTLISISLGIIIEIPGNIAILGILKIALPTEEAALIVLQVNFIGAIEFDKDRLWFFASMYDSRVLFITLEGEMGLLVGWGSDSNFVSAVGGFHPAFNPPPLPFPNPVRISLNILNESWGRIRVMAYFAVTSNTAQFGARAELYFGFSALNVEGHIGFDALFQFSPFYMIISLSASLSVKVFGIGLFSVKVKMSLEGPSPWHANGTGSISLLFFDIDVDFDFTWGEEKDTELPPISVMPILVAEYEKQENWKALVPANNTLFVTLREIDDVAELVLHPVGSLEVTQRAVPLELTLDKVGTQKPDDANHFTLTTADNELAKIKDIDEKFAIAQYKDLKDGEKLSSPSYQPIEGGMELSVEGEQLATGKSVKRHIRYELITIDTNYKRGFNTFFNFITSIFNIFLRGNAVARAEISNANLKKVQPFDIKIKVQEPGFSVASMVDNSQFGNKTFKSQAQAMEFANHQISANPALQGALHVIPNHEINTAA